MKKYDLYVGIDISSKDFDVVTSEGEYYQFSNDLEGFKELHSVIPSSSLVVMESTGVYHAGLSHFLYEQKIAVCVENALRIKRYKEMKLKVNKNDKSDARSICEYAMSQSVKLWEPSPAYIQESELIYQSLLLFKKGLVQYKNKLHAAKRQQNVPTIVYKELTRQVKNHQDSIKKLESELEAIILKYCRENYSRLTSIPGVGKKTAMYALIITSNFTKIREAKSLISFVGLAPIEHRSGTSIWGKNRISKRGNPVLRNLLFLCSFNACKCNKKCKAMYERLLAKGKAKKQALIAVGNKLIRQMFGVIKHQAMYDESFVSTLPMT